MNKPLTVVERERLNRRAKIAKQNAELGCDVDYADDVPIALSAEAFWREAVKNAEVHRQVCAWCAFTGINGHNPDCPWLLAQEAE